MDDGPARGFYGQARKRLQTLHWIQFDEKLLEEWLFCEVWQAKRETRRQYLGWAMGKIYDSVTFPQVLAGTRRRVPGLYHRTDLETGSWDSDTFLENTHETVHASVRARIETGGRPSEPDDTTLAVPSNIVPLAKQFIRRASTTNRNVYNPQRRKGPLYRWQIVRQLNGIVWRYEGRNQCGVQHCEMREEKLGPYETMLARKETAVLVHKTKHDPSKEETSVENGGHSPSHHSLLGNRPLDGGPQTKPAVVIVESDPNARLRKELIAQPRRHSRTFPP